MRIFITGGAGFIGSNLAAYHINKGDHVTVFDNLSRKGGRQNVAWLYSQGPRSRVDFIKGDIRAYSSVHKALPRNVERIYHLAGQVAVTTSVANPRDDFEINGLGTFNALEALRTKAPSATFIYASTNKVYGKMENVAVQKAGTRYVYRSLPLGISEEQPVDFHSPYGCSKGCGDAYTRDYARIYGLRTLVFRQSCIYGPRQFGVEDQGWLAHFCIAAVLGKTINIYGDGKQVRDVLWIDDLIRAYEAGPAKISQYPGEVFNIGGGIRNTISVWNEFRPLLEHLTGRTLSVAYHEWRHGDQLCYVSDIRKARTLLNWQPKVDPKEGIKRLYGWISSNRRLFCR